MGGLEDLKAIFDDDDLEYEPELIHFLRDVYAQQVAGNYKRRSFELLKLEEGARVLDLGCGSGQDTLSLAKLVGDTGMVIGLDSDEHMLAEARKLARDLALPVKYELGDIHALPFADNSFDGCRADRVFQFLDSPDAALAQVVRVARPGARIVICEPDWDTLLFDHPDRVLTRKITQACCDHMVPNGWIGRQLPGLFKAQGMVQVGASSETVPFQSLETADRMLGVHRMVRFAGRIGAVSREEADGWIQSLVDLDRRNRFFCCLTGFVVHGQKKSRRP